jgi:RHH-type proline utilization regulon transcriptional repressor/proline dehydrogenase/delta 1-pyrroline-5-carboxylate dehydrogenase
MRQPFGGMAKSAIGPGLKAGGPNYVSSLMRFRERAGGVVSGKGGALADEHVEGLLASRALRDTLAAGTVERLRAAAASYERAMADEFARDHDDFRLIGQDDVRRYLPVEPLRIRVHEDDDAFDLFARAIAACIARCAVAVSVPPGTTTGPAPPVGLLHDLTEPWAARIEFVEESDEALAAALRDGRVLRVRYAATRRVPAVVWRAAAETGVHVATSPVLAEGRLELLHYLREQSLCVDYHRYGNLGARAAEERTPVG